MHLVDDGTIAVLDLWHAWRSGGMGRGHLPFAGGAAEQPAWLMRAFAIMDAAAEKVRKRSG